MSEEKPDGEEHDVKVQPIILGVIIALIVATLAFILATGDYGEPTPMPNAVPVEREARAPAPVQPAPPEIAPEPLVATVPEPEQIAPQAPVVTEETADAYARTMIDSVNGGKALQQFVAGSYVVERAVAIVDALRRGEVPYKLLPVGRPSTAFPIADNGLRVTMDAAGFSRYDGFATWVNSLDAPALVSLLSDYDAVATDALSRMGVENTSITGAALAATTLILSTPTMPDGAELMKKEANWVYMDPELESLSALQKQILRMGPNNAEIVQQKAREIRGAILQD